MGIQLQHIRFFLFRSYIHNSLIRHGLGRDSYEVFLVEAVLESLVYIYYS